VNNELK